MVAPITIKVANDKAMMIKVSIIFISPFSC